MTRRNHVNFHIGAPRIADRLVENTAGTQAVRSDKDIRVLKKVEYQQYFRSLVNGSSKVSELQTDETEELNVFCEGLSAYNTVVASQHAMMGHPKQAFRQFKILPDAENRIERLCGLFPEATVDLHLVISPQEEYLLQTQTNDVTRLSFEKGLPSWFDLAFRIRNACPDRRLIIWDFSKPTAIALPFVMTMFSLDEGKMEFIKKPIHEDLTLQETLSKVVQIEGVSQELSAALDAQYSDDLTNIETLPDTVVIRSQDVPEDFWLT
ncbi:MAG: hypothetical protein V2I76_08910 [Roseobacter sp.]|jgi:hypothetical protein|nr:hypothetical protein [Roseobacter sp.]